MKNLPIMALPQSGKISVYSLLFTLALFNFIACHSSKDMAAPPEKEQRFSVKDVESAQRIFGLNFSSTEITTLSSSLENNLESYLALRARFLDNSVAPAMYFDPHPAGFRMPDTPQNEINWPIPAEVALPADRNELAFYNIPQLASLIKSRKITSIELTELYLSRLKKYGPTLHSVVTLTEELALRQAQKADAEIAAGLYRGPLHGIPYGAKDLMAVPGYKTTWGAAPFQDQVIDRTATVIKRLEEAGAVLVAKLSSGELAYGDIWFGGQTLNPWDLKQGSNGSSAGSAASTAAGLVAFSLGSETWGSIVSPSNRCGVTGLRPTYGRVSRHGVMTLSWSLDKVGPICRSAIDCALVLDAIRGKDPKDRTVIEAPFNFDPQLDLSQLRVGYLEEEFKPDSSTNGEHNRAALQVFQELGIQLTPFEFPAEVPYEGIISTIIRAESAAAFDELILTNQDDALARQGQVSRANSVRQARFIPASEYLIANRHRSLLIEAMEQLFQQFDLLIVPTNGNENSAISNLTGHPAIVLPNGLDKEGHPTSILLLGRLYDEATILSAAYQYQQATDLEDIHPPAFR